MPAIDLTLLSRRAIFSNAHITISGNILLFSTLAFVVIAFFCSTYTTLRTLLPLLPPHPLTRRTTGSAVGRFDAPPHVLPQKKKLKSAQRFTVWLAAVDIIAAVVLVWEAAFAVTDRGGFGGTKAGASRLYVSCTARPTLLLVVAILSYANVVQGKSIALGTLDWIVWVPATVILAVGAGLASLSKVGGKGVWTGLIIWLSVVTFLVTLSFGRLLVAIIRVRKWTQSGVSAWQREQDLAIISEKKSTPYRQPPSFLPPLHSNFSGLSTSFISTIGTANRSHGTDSSSSHGRPSIDHTPFVAANASSVSYAPSARASVDEEHYRDFRSPTPGSAHRLLFSNSSTTLNALNVDSESYEVTSPASTYSQTPKANKNATALPATHVTPPHQMMMSFEDLPRPSIGSYTSISTFAHAGGLIGGSATRQAIAIQVGASPGLPQSARSKVELSQREARGAVIRIGGHLCGCLLGYAFSTPFLFIRLLKPETLPPLFASILLALAITQPALVLAVQCWLSEGFWFHYERPPVLTSSSAASLEQQQTIDLERPGSATSFFCTGLDVPGIPVTSEDCQEVVKGRVARALSMVNPHPKLQVLPTQFNGGVSTSVVQPNRGHARLRSLTLAKTSLGSLKSHYSDQNRPPRSAALPDRRSSVATLPPPFKTRDFVLSPAPISAGAPTSPPDYSIDYLSSQVLPKLVPFVKVGRNTPVESENAPLNRRRSSVIGLADETGRSVGIGPPPASHKTRNYRNLSLPGIIGASYFASVGNREEAHDVEEHGQKTSALSPSSDFSSIREAIRNGGKLGIWASKRRSMGRTSKAWELVEAQEEKEEKDRGVSGDEADDEEFGDDGEDLWRPPSRPFSSLQIGEGETESLDERSFNQSGDELSPFDHGRRGFRRSPSPLFENPPSTSQFWEPHVSPRLPTTKPKERVVHKGSQFVDQDEEDYNPSIHCATVRPVSRTLDYRSPSALPTAPLRTTHSATGSIESAHSTVSSINSITSVGFRNMMSSGAWHSQDESSADELSSGAERELAEARRTSGLRPLSLLGQRDPNVARDSYSSASDNDEKPESKARPARRRSTSRRTSSNLFVPPPVPATIEEAEEDKRSGSPTPKASRSNPRPPTPVRSAEETRRSMLQYLPDLSGPSSQVPMPLTSTPPAPTKSGTLPYNAFVNSRRGRGNQKQKQGMDENLPMELVVKKMLETKGPATRSSMRNMR